MNNATAESLTDKLNVLDLTDDEATMLPMLIGGTIDDATDDVVAFVQRDVTTHTGAASLQECTISKYDPIRQQVGLKIAPAVHNWSWGASQS